DNSRSKPDDGEGLVSASRSLCKNLRIVYEGPPQAWRCRLAQGLASVFRRTGSAHLAECASKVLLRFEAAGDGNVQHAHFGGTQHLLGSLNSIAQETLVRRLAGRVAEDLREMCRAEPNRTRHFLKA